MFSRCVSWFIYTFAAVAIATDSIGQVPISESDSDVTVHHLRTDNPESSTANRLQKPSTGVDLGALLDAGEGAVVVLVAGDTRLLAHRAVLSARSAVFQRLLQGAATGEVAVPDVEGPVLRQLLSYLYTLQAPQLPAMAPQLLAAAHQYGLPALKADCEQQVAEQLTVETAAATAVLAVRHSCDSLRKATIAYIRERIFHVMATQGWRDAIKYQPDEWIKVVRLLSESSAESSSPAPPARETSPYPAIQPHSDHTDHSGSQTAATAASTTDAQTIPQTVDDDMSLQGSLANGSQTPTTAAPTMAAQSTPQIVDDNISVLRSLSAEEKDRRLIEAAKNGMVGELEALLTAGANVAARERGIGRKTALHWAAREGHTEAARRLLAAGAATHTRDTMQRWTPLHWAAFRGHAPVVRLLLANGADPSPRDLFGGTPLHFAAANGRVEAAAALLEAGADRTARDGQGHTPLDDARRNNEQQLVELLQSR